MIKRDSINSIQRLGKLFPVIVVTGPRQSGKTTLIKDYFKGYEYFNLENPTTLRMISVDINSFIRNHHKKVIFDEIQRLPELLSYIQVFSDEQSMKQNFILSGSENLLISEKVNQSLAGRAAYMVLLPLSLSELSDDKLIAESYLTQIIKGFYPAIYKNKMTVDEVGLYYDEYIATYIERDVRQIKNVVNLNHFRNFLGLLSGRIGQILDKVSIGNDVGVSSSTIEEWLSLLEASYQAVRLRPYYENFGKRFIKSPKIYFVDTGVASRLMNIDNEKELQDHFARGNLFENMCIMEIKKFIDNYKLSTDLYYLRSNRGDEVDLVIDKGASKIFVEIKSSSTVSSDHLSGIRYWKDVMTQKGSVVEKSFVIYDGETLSTSECEYVNWRDLSAITSAVMK